MEQDSKGTELSIDDERMRDHLGRIVRGTVEETPNAMLEAEADRLCNAGRCERTEARRDQRSGSIPTICSSVNLDFFILPPHGGQSLN